MTDIPEPIRHTGGPWYEVDTEDGPVKVRGRDAAVELLAESGGAPVEESTAETFDTSATVKKVTRRGPTDVFTLAHRPDPTSVTVERNGHRVDVTVSDTTIRRAVGHFGRGAWVITYRPA